MVFARLRSMLKSGSSNYAYVTARVRAMKTFLLPADTYPKLLARDVHEIARTLQEGYYKEDVDALAGKHAGARLIELATRRNMGRVYDQILGFCNGELELLVSSYLERYDVFDAKTVLRGVSSGADPEEVRSAILPGGTVPTEVWESAFATGDVNEAIDVMATEAPCAVLAQHKGASLAELEDALDRAYYQRLSGVVAGTDRAKQAFDRFIRREIDLLNLKAVLRLKQSGVAEFEPVPGGLEVDEAIARRVLNAQPSEVAGILDQTSYGPQIKEALEAWSQSGDLNPIITALDQYHLATAQEFSHLYPLSILPIVDYVLRKRVEVDNLRAIAVGKASGLDADTIRTMVMT